MIKGCNRGVQLNSCAISARTSPFIDKPGKIRRKWLHTYRQYIEPKQVEKLGKTVEELVKAIIEQMEEKEKSWVKTWIDKPEIFLVEYTST